MHTESSSHQNVPVIRVGSRGELILADNSARVESFRTRTIIAEEDGKRFVYKCPASEKAKPFVKGIAAKERADAEYLKGHFEVHVGTLEGDHIKYDYLPYPSLEDRMQFLMREGDLQTAQNLLDEYVRRIEALDTIHAVPEEFLSLVADGADCRSKTNCLVRGLLDLTPKNILINSNRWIVLDSEWSFDFPVPTRFVLFRAIRELAIGLQREIRQITSRDIPAFSMFACGLRAYYVPLIWVKHILSADMSLRRVMRWEAGFWQYTTGAKKGHVGRIKRRLSLRTRFSACSMICDRRVYIGTKRFLMALPSVNRLVHILDR